MQALIPIALFGWIPVVLLIFSALPPRRAVMVSFIAAWLFLPYAGYNFPGIPDYSKRSAASLGVLLATALFQSDRLMAVRLRWFDVPMLTWCLCPIASSTLNTLGLYDGLSTSFDYFVTWGLPYLIGRVFFTRFEHLREMAIGILMGGMVYAPLCLWEARMSPQLHLTVYGFDSGWGEVVYGGYRPKVFMATGLELGLWMTATSTIGVWLWASGALKQIRGVRFGGPLIVLLIATVLCRVTGAWLLLFLGVSLWYVLKLTRSPLPVIALILIPILYMSTRSTGLWTGEGAVHLVRTMINARRAQSLEFRMQNEDLLVRKALQRPVFGWGGWGRARVFDDEGRDITITDGMWVIAIGNTGLVGLLSFNTSLLLPLILLVRRCPIGAWLTPTMAPACVLATLLTLYSIDCIANAMVNPTYFLALGAVTGILGPLDRRRLALAYQSGERIYHPHGPAGNRVLSGCEAEMASGTEQEEVADPREEAAISLGTLARTLAGQGSTREAEDAWHSALQYRAELVADYPGDMHLRQCWLDSLNDAAWSLVSANGHEVPSVPMAIQYAEQTVQVDPGNATYWNTLGIAYYRGGAWDAAIHALERSRELSEGGTSFDYFFMAMACEQRGDDQGARHWYSRGLEWMEQHDPQHPDLLRFRQEAHSVLQSRPKTLQNTT